MQEKFNCWEYFQCGREPGGENANEKGICSVPIKEESDGINHGRAAGRLCWTIKDAECPTSILAKFKECIDCPFYIEVIYQEGIHFVLGL